MHSNKPPYWGVKVVRFIFGFEEFRFMKQVLKTSLLTKAANRSRIAISLSMTVLLGSCGPIASSGGLKIGSLLPSTGDLSSVGQPMIATVPLLVDTVNACGGVNGKPVELVAADDETDPTKGNQAMTQLAEVDKVAGVVGSFASSVSTSAVDVAVRNKVMLVSPGSTSPVFTERAKQGVFKGYWARTAPPDTYQARALAKLARDKGLKRVSTVVINNDYGVGFEKEFVTAFKKLGGTIVNESKPTRYDPKAPTLDSEAAAAFGGKPDGVAAVLYAETGSQLLKAAYQAGLSKGVQLLLTDGVKSDDFAKQVGKTKDGKFIIDGAIGTVPGADGKALKALTALWQSKKNGAPPAYVPQAWDAGALLALSSEAAKANTGEAIASKIREVSGGPGEEVTDVCKGLELLKAGKKINYQGASGNVDIDANGDVVGVYDVWQVAGDGKTKVIGKVAPQ
jgi:neutral amino acid transport system substrate-binding protein